MEPKEADKDFMAFLHELECRQGFRDELQLGLNSDEQLSPGMQQLMQRVKAIAAEHKVVFVTTPSRKPEGYCLDVETYLNGKTVLNADSLCIALAKSSDPQIKTMFGRNNSKIRNVSLEMDEKEVVERCIVMGRTTGKSIRTQEWFEKLTETGYKRMDQGGFASTPMEYDDRSRAVRRGHKPPKILKGQNYLALRGRY